MVLAGRRREMILHLPPQWLLCCVAVGKRQLQFPASACADTRRLPGGVLVAGDGRNIRRKRKCLTGCGCRRAEGRNVRNRADGKRTSRDSSRRARNRESSVWPVGRCWSDQKQQCALAVPLSSARSGRSRLTPIPSTGQEFCSSVATQSRGTAAWASACSR